MTPQYQGVNLPGARVADHYAVLQILPTADPVVVRAAYRALAGIHHPDLAGGSEARMRAVNEAWAVLGDTDLRRAYDRQRALSSISAEIRDADAGPTVVPDARPGSGTELDFGRYAGWTVGALSRHDPDYLRWLVRMPVGRRYSAEVESLLNGRSTVPVMERPESGRRRFGRHGAARQR